MSIDSLLLTYTLMWSILADVQYESGHSFQTTLTVRLFMLLHSIKIQHRIRNIQPYMEFSYV